MIVWVILAMLARPNAQQFEVDNVTFATLADCDAAARQWEGALVTVNVRNGHAALRWDVPAPQGSSSVTYTCVERKQ